MMGSDGISVADAIALGRNNTGYNDGNGAFGGNGAWFRSFPRERWQIPRWRRKME